MRKSLVVVLVGLMALGAFSVTLAQDGLPWSVTPPQKGQDVSDTAEFHTYTVQTLKEGQCVGVYVKVVDTVGSVPDVFEVFVQRGDNRYVSDIHKHLSVGLNQISVNLKALKLKDKPTADVFDPNQGAISDLGLHLWDPEHQMNITVTRLYLYDCETQHEVTAFISIPNTQTGTSFCVEKTTKIVTIGKFSYVDFAGNLTKADPSIFMNDGGVKSELTAKLDSYISASDSTRYQLPDLDLTDELIFGALFIC